MCAKLGGSSAVASAFDPSAFIAAEERRRALSAPARVLATPCDRGTAIETRGNQPFSDEATTPLATIATVAAPATDMRFPWSADLLRFVERPCPIDERGDYWSELQEEAWSVSREWGETAIAAGWSALNLFGSNPDPAAGRVDRDGLVVSICRLRSPVTIVAIDSEAASLRCPRGSIMKHRRHARPGTILLWEAYPMTAGP